ncbi:MAG: hypothetical protein AVDCRST_MAG43-750 [uncultured Thermomicrobiales bacterium]|uniref:Uncharacterized protein n=1 Tax=uncultured Thermomicrobiales bacterium TaxID=1645740 RepID=A0A6J4UER6_9BACT|nr:MAG: hypothetical protein AVDCRST_MAG43-750 [uncultured Thermomicrobiales bacterium]
MDVGAALVADGQAAVAVELGEDPLDDPAVAAQSLARIDPLAGDAYRNAPPLPEPAALGRS